MNYVAALVAGFVTVTIIAGLLRDPAVIRGALTLLGNWIVLTGASMLTENQYNEPLNAAVDWASIWIGFAPSKHLPQVLMAALFGVSMMFHADFLFKRALGIPFAQLKHPYWWRFYWLSWTQIALMIGWECHGGRRLLIRHFGRSRSLSLIPARRDLAGLSVDGR